jgi:hypothetical protein
VERRQLHHNRYFTSPFADTVPDVTSLDKAVRMCGFGGNVLDALHSCPGNRICLPDQLDPLRKTRFSLGNLVSCRDDEIAFSLIDLKKTVNSKGIVLPRSSGSTFPRRLTDTGRRLRGSPFAPHFISAERVDIEGSPGGN